MHVLIVEDHPLYSAGMRILLTTLDPSVQTSEVGTLAQALAFADKESVELVLLDLHLPDCKGVECVGIVKDAFAAAPVVIVSGDEKPEHIREAIEAGAAGYVPKTTDTALTVQALRVVMAHGVYLPLAAMRAEPEIAKPITPVRLSPRQTEILIRLLQGKPNKIIARELNVAEGTVKAHLSAVYEALGAKSRTQAMFRAHRLGLLDSLAAESSLAKAQ